MSKTRERYGLKFPAVYDDAQIEREMLRQGGYFIHGNKKFGLGLFQHFKNYWQCLWPDDEQTRWTDLMLKEILENRFVGIIGPGSSWKTSTCARIALMDWSLFPECTMVIMSSTTMSDLRNRIYGEASKFWSSAKEHHRWFPGYPLDYLCTIATDNIEEEETRDLRNGIQGIPNKTSEGKVQGQSRFAGKKNTRVWAVCDEVQFCERSFLDSQNNLSSNGPNLVPGYERDDLGNILVDSKGQKKILKGYKAIFIGNPNPTRPENCLHLVCEPQDGWASLPDDGLTKVWTARKVPNNVVQARVINLDARDSPNNDYPEDSPRWINLCSKKRLKEFQEGSESYWTQGVGFVKLGLAGCKVITKEVCDQFHAFDQVVWEGTTPTTKIGMLDAAYGGVGGDRCVVGWLEFGKCLDGVIRILFHPPIIVPIIIRPDIIPEDQIAMFCKSQMEQAGVTPDNFFFDGRGSVSISFARIWSPRVNAVEFGGRPTTRPVNAEFMVDDPIRMVKRPKLAEEHYANFVSELWWSWRYTIESDQVRGLTIETIQDAWPREWGKVRGDKIQIETKEKMRVRTGCSPDLGDLIAIGIEGARRRGFNVAKLAVESLKPKPKESFLEKHLLKLKAMQEAQELQSA